MKHLPPSSIPPFLLIISLSIKALSLKENLAPYVDDIVVDIDGNGDYTSVNWGGNDNYETIIYAEFNNRRSNPESYPEETHILTEGKAARYAMENFSRSI